MINLKSELGRMLMKSVHLIMHQQEEWLKFKSANQEMIE
jgi:hypothetical protein